MTAQVRRGTPLILASFAAGLLLTLVPMPYWAAEYRPQWVALLLIYWTLIAPARVGVFSALAAGLVLDVLTGTVLGQHALSLSVVGFLAVELRQRVLPFPGWQQALSVWVLLLVERLLSLWILGATGQPTPSLVYWVPTLIGMLLWPWLQGLLEALRERLGPA